MSQISGNNVTDHDSCNISTRVSGWCPLKRQYFTQGLEEFQPKSRMSPASPAEHLQLGGVSLGTTPEAVDEGAGMVV
jgi:hypothetical protein